MRDEKLKVLRALRPIVDAEVSSRTVRGQYQAGAIAGNAVPGYFEELGARDSRTETFVAIRAEARNWRWAGVPFYLRTGKLPALFSHREHKCPSRLSPAERLDELVWADLRELLSHPEQVTRALGRAHGGNWLPQELQARQQRLRRGQAGLRQQLERLTGAYLAGVVALAEYRRRRGDLEDASSSSRSRRGS